VNRWPVHGSLCEVVARKRLPQVKRSNTEEIAMLDFGLLGTPSAMPMDAAESLVNGKSNAALALDSFAVGMVLKYGV
jgi:hypothetical protein